MSAEIFRRDGQNLSCSSAVYRSEIKSRLIANVEASFKKPFVCPCVAELLPVLRGIVLSDGLWAGLGTGGRRSRHPWRTLDSRHTGIVSLDYACLTLSSGLILVWKMAGAVAATYSARADARVADAGTRLMAKRKAPKHDHVAIAPRRSTRPIVPPAAGETVTKR